MILLEFTQTESENRAAVVRFKGPKINAEKWTTVDVTEVYENIRRHFRIRAMRTLLLS